VSGISHPAGSRRTAFGAGLRASAGISVTSRSRSQIVIDVRLDISISCRVLELARDLLF
jgi:hypothetical protein